ncbi:nicotianamine [Stylosanthes scabra]|uniref:Nicotianamine synthase n=1 Tax=Stylosanthes scabra TaxID=79078 RepID=A0ABU6QXG0_9FABA|nr:nicotianamine [Stylosanthes scabra]
MSTVAVLIAFPIVRQLGFFDLERLVDAFPKLVHEAFVGMEKEEKNRVIDHLAKHIAPGAVLMLRSAHGAVLFYILLLNPVILEALRFSLCSTLLMRLSILLSCLVNTLFLRLNKNKDLFLL